MVKPDETASSCSHGLTIEVPAKLVHHVNLHSSFRINWVDCWILPDVHDHLVDLDVCFGEL